MGTSGPERPRGLVGNAEGAEEPQRTTCRLLPALRPRLRLAAPRSARHGGGVSSMPGPSHPSLDPSEHPQSLLTNGSAPAQDPALRRRGRDPRDTQVGVGESAEIRPFFTPVKRALNAGLLCASHVVGALPRFLI